MPTECKICKKICRGNRGLGMHLRQHQISAEEYCLKYTYKNKRPRCLECGKITNYLHTGWGFRKLCSYKCAGVYRQKHMSPESQASRKEKCKSFWTTEERNRQGKLSKDLYLDPRYTEIHSQRLSKRNLENWQNPGYRARMLTLWSIPGRKEAHTKRLVQRNTENWQSAGYRRKMLQLGYGLRGNHFSSRAHLGTAHYRSSWELAAFEQLDKDSNVILYVSEPFGIPYVFKNARHTYYPDILVVYANGLIKLIEIKPFRRIKEERNTAKFDIAKSYCVDNNIVFEIWTKEHSNEFTIFNTPKRIAKRFLAKEKF